MRYLSELVRVLKNYFMPPTLNEKYIAIVIIMNYLILVHKGLKTIKPIVRLRWGVMTALNVEKFRELTPSEFFYRNREIAGFTNPARALYQTVRELIENSLDATETYGILPEIRLSIKLDDNDPTKVTVRAEDNGIGIPAEEIPNVFAKVFYGSKYVLRQARGVFGLGIKMVVR